MLSLFPVTTLNPFVSNHWCTSSCSSLPLKYRWSVNHNELWVSHSRNESLLNDMLYTRPPSDNMTRCMINGRKVAESEVLWQASESYTDSAKSQPFLQLWFVNSAFNNIVINDSTLQWHKCHILLADLQCFWYKITQKYEAHLYYSPHRRVTNSRLDATPSSAIPCPAQLFSVFFLFISDTL